MDGNNLASADSETVWGQHVGGCLYKLDNVPVLARGISLGDTIEAAPGDGPLEYRGTACRGGHSTYRIVADGGWRSPAVSALLDNLRDQGCTIEVATPQLIAVDVPREVDVCRVYATLDRAEKIGIALFEEGHRGHPICKS